MEPPDHGSVDEAADLEDDAVRGGHEVDVGREAAAAADPALPEAGASFEDQLLAVEASGRVEEVEQVVLATSRSAGPKASLRPRPWYAMSARVSSACQAFPSCACVGWTSRSTSSYCGTHSPSSFVVSPTAKTVTGQRSRGAASNRAIPRCGEPPAWSR